MSLREWEIREAKRAGLAAFLYVSVGVLQAIVGRWWLVAVAGFLVLLYMAVAVMAWAVARAAKPWQEPVVSRPRRWELWLNAAACVSALLVGFGDLVTGAMLDGGSWVLASLALWLRYRRDRERRELTEPPPKPPARLGPPMEWID